MSKLVFNLKSVPYDEAEDVKSLLTEHNISFFESPPGNWGISVHALWLKDDAQEGLAKRLIAEYQLERSERMKRDRQERIDNGEVETFVQSIVRRPVQFFASLVIILVILYFSVMPFFDMASA